jgi:ribosomal protein L37AE/L43A
MRDTFATRSHPLTCPFCETHELRPFGHGSARCYSCGSLLSSAFLETLQRII